jgi:ribosome-associated protein
MSGPRVNADGSLFIRSRLTIPFSEIELRVTTSGGPGGQHANRSLTRVVVSFHVNTSEALSETERGLLIEKVGTVVRSSASRYRSQAQNKSAALEQLALKIATGLTRQAPRKATKPTKSSKVRRVDEKKARSRVKENRRRPVSD